MIFPRPGSARFRRPAPAVNPVSQLIIFIQEKLIHVAGRISPGGRKGNDHALCAAFAHGKGLGSDIFNFYTAVPCNSIGEQKPVIVVDKPGVNFLKLFWGSFVDFLAVVGRVFLTVGCFKCHLIDLRLPNPETADALIPKFDIEGILNLLYLVKHINTIRTGNAQPDLFGPGLAYITYKCTVNDQQNGQKRIS